MMNSGLISYVKPWLSVADQVSILERRGVVVSDRSAAEVFLLHTNYYRLAGYCLAFEDTRHSFHKNVTFEQLEHCYDFDTQLRDLFFEALELIEIELRASVSHYVGREFGAFGHVHADTFHPKFSDDRTTHADWLRKLRHQTEQSRETFVEHFRNTYSQFPDLPIWAATEIMSFGSLSLMIKALRRRDCKAIADQYELAVKVFPSFIHHLTYIRNMCAHHCRLWDRKWAIRTRRPRGASWKNPTLPSTDRLFMTILIMRKMMQQNSHLLLKADAWRDRVTTLLSNPPAVSDPSTLMGLTEKWQTHPVWL